MFQLLSPKVEGPSGYFPMRLNRDPKTRPQNRPQGLKRWCITLTSPLTTSQLPAWLQPPNPECCDLQAIARLWALAPHLHIGQFNSKLFFSFCTTNSCSCMCWASKSRQADYKKKKKKRGISNNSKERSLPPADRKTELYRFPTASVKGGGGGGPPTTVRFMTLDFK